METNHNCKIDGCERSVYGHGLCESHCRRLRLYGDPLKRINASKGEPLRFLKDAIKRSTDDCIQWPYAKITAGYGTVTFDGKTVLAHRLALILATGTPVDESMDCAHAPKVCHDRSCINPRHLRWATRAENLADRYLDGTELNGSRIFGAKLTPEDVLAIRKDQRFDRLVAADYGVSRRSIGRIRDGSTWKHV